MRAINVRSIRLLVPVPRTTILVARSLATCLGVLALAAGCSAKTRSETASVQGHEELVVVPGATNIQYPEGFEAAVSYLVKVPYPAESVLRTIRSNLEERGWQALDEDIYNPGMPTSEVTGWGEFTREDGAIVHGWHGQWQNASRAVVWYDIRYEPRSGEREEKSICHITGIFFSATAAEAVKKRAVEMFQRAPRRNTAFLTLAAGKKVAVLNKNILENPRTFTIEYLTHIPTTDRCALQREVRSVWEAIHEDARKGARDEVRIVARPVAQAGGPASSGEEFVYTRQGSSWTPVSGFILPGC